MNIKKPSFVSVKKCRICHNEKLIEFFNLGEHPLANAFLKKEDLMTSEQKYPLRVLWCPECNLVQLGEVVDPNILFFDYVYFSSGMPASKHFRDYAQSVVKNFISSPDELVVEIASNDGHFLEVVKETHPNILGVDPAKNIAKFANERGIPTIPDFFTEKLAKEIVNKSGHAKAIIANNVVAHINDHHDLMKGVSFLLDEKGVFIVEAPYLIDMFENLTFDTIYHEHLSYLAIRPLARLFEEYGLEIFDVQIYPVQGNSLRVFVGKKGMHPILPLVREFLLKEKNMGLDKFESYVKLEKKISALKSEVVDLLKKIKNEGKKIAGYGAPAKGNTLLNYFNIDADTLDYVTETLPTKIGLYTPGMHIPVADINWARQNSPDFYFLLAWNYKDKILEKERDFISKGGKFIMPIGEERIL
jgi:hypothetical protein